MAGFSAQGSTNQNQVLVGMCAFLEVPKNLTSERIQVAGRIQFLPAVGLRFPFSCGFLLVQVSNGALIASYAFNVSALPYSDS